jgi:hypothetical protein
MVLCLSVAMTGVIAASAIQDKTPGSGTPSGSLPPGGGTPAPLLFLTGTLSFDGGLYKIAVDALPGYVVPLSLPTPNLQSWAASHLGQDVTVWGHWDKNDLTVFVVQSTNPS